MTQARAAAMTTSQDGELRAQLSRVTEKYEKAVADHEVSSRTCALLKGDLEHAHVQLSKARSDKAKVDRELRKAHSALQLAQSSSASNANSELAAEADKSELEFYKGKSSSLGVQLNRLGAVVAEKDRQLDEMRRQLERYQMMNHHKLPDSATSGNFGGAGGGGGGGVPKSKSH